MFNKKNKKQIKRVQVTCIDERDYATEHVPSSIRIFDVPEGGSVEVQQFEAIMNIYDSDGDVVTKVRWQPGFTQQYHFFYDIKQVSNC